MLPVRIRKELYMRTLKLVAAALIIGGLTGCASTGEPASVAARHQHLRDAKQGPAASATVASSDQPAPKLLHDHREMK